MAASLQLTLPDWLEAELAEVATPLDEAAAMRLAIGLSRRNVELGSGGPFGAVIVTDKGELVAAGVNRVESQHCSAAHAEVMAFMFAQQRLGRFRLNADGRRYHLVTSAQPCAMCYGASFWAGIDAMVIGARSEDVMRLTEFDEGPLPADWSGELERRGIAVRRDVLREEACATFDLYRRMSGHYY